MDNIRPFSRVMVANRGEIAIRIFRALAELNMQSICVFSKEDKYSLFRTKADESYILDREKGPIDAYLDIDNIIRIAKERRVDAIHPGYGFLSENPDFVDACEQAGIAFIGPSKASMSAMGDKLSSKKIAIECGVPVIPGVDHALMTYDEVRSVTQTIGFPVMLKASNGGGGRGMRIVYEKAQLEKEYNEAKAESQKAFGSDKIFIEKYLTSPKHVEVQVLGDRYGDIVHLYDRDCSVQRRHQKIVEYAPAFTVPETTRKKMLTDAVKLAQHVKYSNAGTLEFLVDANGNYYFIEMNPRIQVEHTVSEMVTGIDIVQSQILIAQGYPLASEAIDIPSQDAVHCFGHAIQTRVTTENPANHFFPDTGKLNVYRSGSGFGIRLDGGNAFTGSEILPFYDSLLVKVIAHDRSFNGCARKLRRSLKELRVRGVKTNVPFLVNVLENEAFLTGRATTSFIEETPSLFNLPESQDRATKLLEFIGNKIVNETKGDKKSFAEIKKPAVDTKVTVRGMKDVFKELGAKGLCDKILTENRLLITDTTMRDAHQSLFATRMRTFDMLAAAPVMNRVLQNSFSAEVWGGATFDVAYRFLTESPWRRLEQLSEAMPNTLLQMLLRASNAVGYKNYPDNVVRQFIRASAESGVDVFRIFDSLNWLENMELPIEEALKTGKIVEGAICYTGDISNPHEVKYTLDYYLQKAVALEKMGAHIIAIKDMAGLLRPYDAKTLVSALKMELHVPVHLHTHDSTGNGVAAVLMAAEAGVDIVDLALESMSGLTSQPSMNAVAETVHGTSRDTGLHLINTRELSRYFGDVRKVYKRFESEMTTPNTEIYKYEIPGGQYSNLLAQVKDMGDASEFTQIKVLYKEANDLLGNIVKVTPSSKVVGDLAIFMHKNGLNTDNILTAGKDLSYPDSVVDYFMGMIGQPDGGFPPALQAIVLKGETPIEGRPGALLPDENFDAIAKHLADDFRLVPNARNTISHALYPKVYDEYCKHLTEYNDVSKLPSHVYFNGLAKGEEVTVKIAEGKYLIIKYIDGGEVNRHGKRALTFEVNGATREVEITDFTQEAATERKVKADKTDASQLGSPIPGTVGRIMVEEGDYITMATPLMTIEAMKMETTLMPKAEGVIDKIHVKPGASVVQDELLITWKK